MIRHSIITFLGVVLVAACAALLFGGCATTGNAQIGRDDLIAQVRAGTSTRDEVKALLGQPSAMMQLPLVRGREVVGTEEQWTYYRFAMKARPATFIPIVGPLVGGFDTDSRSLTVRFDDKGVVSWVGFGHIPGRTGP